jgi:hypothetical protein
MRPAELITLVILVVATYFSWRVMRGSSGGVPLYALIAVVPLCLLGVALAGLVDQRRIVEVLTVAAVAFSLAILPATPRLYEEELRADLKDTHVFQVFQPNDALSWRAWLKLVDRIGAGRAALVFLAVLVLAMLCALPVLLAMSQDVPPGFVLVTLVAPALFAGFATLWLYRAARRLVPGS